MSNILVNPNEKYLKAEIDILNQEVNYKKKGDIKSLLCGIFAPILIGLGILGAVFTTAGSEHFALQITAWLASLFIGMFLTFAGIPTRKRDDNSFSQLRVAQKKFLNSYGLEISDSGLSDLNFPDLYSKKRDMLYGVTDVVDKSTGALKKVMLRGTNNGQLVLLDETGKELTPSF